MTHETREDFSSTTSSPAAPTLLKSARDLPSAARAEFLARIDALAATQSMDDTLDLAALLLTEVGINISSIRLDRCGFVMQWRSPRALNQNAETKTFRVSVRSNTLEADCDSQTDAMSERTVNTVLRAALIQLERCSRRAWEYAPPTTSSESARQLASDIERVARLPYSVLITGETGTGKTRAAREIHQHSVRSSKPFVELNCAALPEHLVEAELFGYRKGAFTGADRDHKGLFEEADGGILFLDEIGDLSLSVQNKLLKAIDEKQVKRLGTNCYLSCDVQIIAATSRDLSAMVQHGEFREDLYCRLAMLRIKVAPLRERRAEIPTLLDAFLREASETVSRSAGRPINYSIEAGAVEALCAHSWLGNVRVLRNAVFELTSYVADDELITIERVRETLVRSSGLVADAPETATPNATVLSPRVAGTLFSPFQQLGDALQSLALEGEIVLPVEVCLLRRDETLDAWLARVKRCGIEATCRAASNGRMREAASRLGITHANLRSQLYRARSKTSRTRKYD